MAGVHGNETCGLRAFENILPKLSIQRGSVTFLYGNPRAIAVGRRFVEANLNRVFRDDADLTSAERDSYEYRRSRELMPFLASADALLDIHSSGTPEAIPFAVSEERSLCIAEKLSVPLISSGWDTIQPGGTDYFVNKNDGMGLCIECGFHEDPAAIVRAEQAIFAFLVRMGAIDDALSLPASSQRRVEIFYLYKTQKNFQPRRPFRDFEKVSKGTIIGMDGGIEITAPEDCLVIFVRAREREGEEGFILGREVNSNFIQNMWRRMRSYHDLSERSF